MEPKLNQYWAHYSLPNRYLLIKSIDKYVALLKEEFYYGITLTDGNADMKYWKYIGNACFKCSKLCYQQCNLS